MTVKVLQANIASSYQFGWNALCVCNKVFLFVWQVDDFSIFFSAVIDKASFDRNKSYLDYANQSAEVEVLAGGNCDDSVGYFVEPTVVQCNNPKDKLMQEVRCSCRVAE